MPTRRPLTFATLDDAVRDAEHLLAAGYERAGNWTLGQACAHLALWIEYPLDGFPRLPAWQRPLAWVLRNTVAPVGMRRVLTSGRTPRGIPAPLGTVPPATVGDAAEVTRYARLLGRLRDYQGVPHPSPILGPMTAGQLVALSRVHAAHHLSFLVPKTEPLAASR